MDQKAKMFIGILAVIIAVLVGLVFIGYDAKQKLEQDRDSLKEKNEQLIGDVNKSRENEKRLDERVKSLTSKFDQVSREKDDLSRRYMAVEQAKNDLQEQINRLKAQRTEAPASSAMAAPSFMPAISSGGQANDAYWAGVLKAKTDLELKLETISAEVRSAKINNEQLQREKSSMQLEISNLGREKEDLRRQLDYNQKMMDSVAQELVREKNDKIKIQDQVKPLKNENLALRRQLETLNSRKIDLERKLTELQAKNMELDSRFNEMDTFLKGKINELDILKRQLVDGPSPESAAAAKAEALAAQNAVELPPIVVRPSNTPAASDPETRSLGLVGRILSTDLANNFVVIDLGEDAGVSMGDVFKVSRDGEEIGSIEVIQVRNTISACDIKKKTTTFKIGDTVK